MGSPRKSDLNVRPEKIHARIARIVAFSGVPCTISLSQLNPDKEDGRRLWPLVRRALPHSFRFQGWPVAARWACRRDGIPAHVRVEVVK